MDISPLGDNSWLAGFSSGDGTFEVRTTEKLDFINNKIARHFSTTFSLFQSRIDPELLLAYKPIMETISTFLLAKLGVH